MSRVQCNRARNRAGKFRSITHLFQVWSITRGGPPESVIRTQGAPLRSYGEMRTCNCRSCGLPYSGERLASDGKAGGGHHLFKDIRLIIGPVEQLCTYPDGGRLNRNPGVRVAGPADTGFLVQNGPLA